MLKFDRGTILIPKDLEDAVVKLPTDELVRMQLLWDPRSRQFRAPAFRYAEVKARLGLANGGYGNYLLEKSTSGSSLSSLRPYQHSALNAWLGGNGRGLVVLPTGAGKTILALHAMTYTTLDIICLVPTRVLLEQWFSQLREVFPERLGRLGDGYHDVAPITIATYESAMRQMPRIGHRFGLLIVDEAHHVSKGRFTEALEMCAAPLRLGLTATPHENPEAVALLDRLIGPKLIHISMDELVGTYLAPYRVVRLPVQLSPTERGSYGVHHKAFQDFRRDFARSGGDTSYESLVKFAWQDSTGRGAAALVSRSKAARIAHQCSSKLEATQRILERHGTEQCLVFTPNVPMAYEVAERLGFPAITGEIKRAEREVYLSGFRSGKLRTLVSCRVLNEGFDLPQAHVGIVLGGTHGKGEHLQRLGRLLRPLPGKEAILYELVASQTLEEWKPRYVAGSVPSRHTQRRSVKGEPGSSGLSLRNGSALA